MRSRQVWLFLSEKPASPSAPNHCACVWLRTCEGSRSSSIACRWVSNSGTSDAKTSMKTAVAPGLATRRASRKPPLKLRQWWAEKRLATKSNSASGNGSASAEASTVSMLSMPRVRADDATAANISVDKSQATTRPVELARA